MQMQVTLARRAHLSCGRRIENASYSEVRNKEVYGSLYVPAGLGANFVLEALVSGPVSPDTGMVLNLKDFDEALKEVERAFDHRYLNSDHPRFKESVPTSENILLEIRDLLRPLLKVNLNGLRLFEDDRCWYSWSEGERTLFLTRTYRISALHRHHNPTLSAEENQALYGKCAGIHGHDYRLEVTVKNSVDPETGLLFSRDEMDAIVGENVVDVFHGSMLNELMGNTSGELILFKFQERLTPVLPLFHSLRVRETRKNHFSSIPVIEERVS